MKIRRSGRSCVYIVQCADGTYYTGYTPDIEKRIKLHNSGRGAKYTRGRGPVNIKWCRTYMSRSNAVKKEAEIKKMTRREKEGLIRKSGIL